MARRLVVEADGGSRGNPGPAAYGALVRDADTGEVLAEVAEHIGTASNNVAEYRALIAGLAAAREIDPDARVEARMDSKLVVEQMAGRWQVRHPGLRPLVEDARAIFPRRQVTYRWVPRADNAAADALVNQALDAAALGRAWTPRSGTADETATVIEVDEAEIEPVPQNAVIGWADLGTPTTFVMLRHGETSHTGSHRFSGAGGDDPPLTEHGRWQAQRVAELVAARGTVDAVVSSPLRRALHTAEAAARAMGVDVRLEDGFRECAFGEWDGCTFDEVRTRWPDELAAWLASTAVAPPGGESFDAVAERVRLARDKTIARHSGRTVLVVTHVTPIKTLVRLALGAPPSALYRMELQPASLSVLQWYADGNASLHLFNDTGHLRP
jgi:ribonuclease H / adenosylcobalamin/alpha-ribazole phosphatase